MEKATGSTPELDFAKKVAYSTPELVLVLDHIRSSYNFGAILRTDEGLGVKKIVLSGYTPRFNDPNLLPHLCEKLNREIHKTALGAENMLEIYSSGDIFSTLKDYHKQGYHILGLENNLPDRPLLTLGSPALNQALKFPAVLILGEEVHGIDYSLHDIIDLFIEIPMRGQKESFNVSVAAGIVMFELLF